MIILDHFSLCGILANSAILILVLVVVVWDRGILSEILIDTYFFILGTFTSQ